MPITLNGDTMKTYKIENAVGSMHLVVKAANQYTARIIACKLWGIDRADCFSLIAYPIG